MTLPQRHLVVSHEVQKDRQTIRWWLNHRQRFPSSAAPYHRCVSIGIRAPGDICSAGQRLVKSLKVLRRIEDRLVAKQRAAELRRLVRQHLDGWMCIHHQEGAWNSNTGNGFYGGLQMTKGWAGIVERADLLPPSAQIAAAETVAAKHGWSWDWMHGQWPNTFPPCSHFFQQQV